MENLVPLRNPFSTTELGIIIGQCSSGRKVGEATQNSVQKYSGESGPQFHVNLWYCDEGQ